MTITTGIRITTEGTIEAVELSAENLLAELYAGIGCELIEVAQLDGGIDAIFDEEGKVRAAEPNARATWTARLLGWQPLPGDFLAGDVIFLGFTEDGDHVSLSPDQARDVRTAANL